MLVVFWSGFLLHNSFPPGRWSSSLPCFILEKTGRYMRMVVEKWDSLKFWPSHFWNTIIIPEKSFTSAASTPLVSSSVWGHLLELRLPWCTRSLGPAGVGCLVPPGCHLPLLIHVWWYPLGNVFSSSQTFFCIVFWSKSCLSNPPSPLWFLKRRQPAQVKAINSSLGFENALQHRRNSATCSW